MKEKRILAFTMACGVEIQPPIADAEVVTKEVVAGRLSIACSTLDGSAQTKNGGGANACSRMDRHRLS